MRETDNQAARTPRVQSRKRRALKDVEDPTKELQHQHTVRTTHRMTAPLLGRLNLFPNLTMGLSRKWCVLVNKRNPAPQQVKTLPLMMQLISSLQNQRRMLQMLLRLYMNRLNLYLLNLNHRSRVLDMNRSREPPLKSLGQNLTTPLLHKILTNHCSSLLSHRRRTKLLGSIQ